MAAVRLMADAIFVCFHLLGLAGLVSGVIAFVRNRREPGTRAGRVGVVVLGALLAASSVFVAYPLSDTRRIVGFPFMVAMFEKRGTNWDDFVGPLTLPALAGNILFALAVPQIVVYVWRRRAGPPSPRKLP